MRNSLFNSLTIWINKLINFYQAISKINSSTPGLRIISYDCDKSSGEVRFIVQVTGKNIFPKMVLRDLEQATLLSNFSEQDQQIIRNFLAKSDGQPEMRIIARTFDRDKKQFTFTIESMHHNRKVTVDDLSPFMRDHMHLFDQEDSDLIQYESRRVADLSS